MKAQRNLTPTRTSGPFLTGETLSTASPIVPLGESPVWHHPLGRRRVGAREVLKLRQGLGQWHNWPHGCCPRVYLCVLLSLWSWARHSGAAGTACQSPNTAHGLPGACQALQAMHWSQELDHKLFVFLVIHNQEKEKPGFEGCLSA